MTRKSMLPVPVKGKQLIKHSRTIGTQTKKCVIRSPSSSMSTQESQSFNVESDLNDENNQTITSSESNYASTPKSPFNKRLSPKPSSSINTSETNQDSVEKAKRLDALSKLTKSVSLIKKSSSQHEIDFSSQLKSQLQAKRYLTEDNSNLAFRFEINDSGDNIECSQNNDMEIVQEINQPIISDSSRNSSTSLINSQSNLRTPNRNSSSNHQADENLRSQNSNSERDDNTDIAQINLSRRKKKLTSQSNELKLNLSPRKSTNNHPDLNTSIEPYYNENVNSLHNTIIDYLEEDREEQNENIDIENHDLVIEDQNNEQMHNDDSIIPSSQIPTTSHQSNQQIVQNKKSKERISEPIKRKRSSARFSIKRKIPNEVYNTYNEDSTYFNRFSLENKKEILRNKEEQIEDLKNQSSNNNFRRSERLRSKQIKKLNHQKMILNYLIRMDEQDIEMDQQANRRFSVNLKYVNVRGDNRYHQDRRRK